MSYLTKYGTMWGDVPQTVGRIFWVSAGATTIVDGRTVTASDDNDGLSPERPLRTINRAWNLVTANANDVIALMRGAHDIGTETGITADIAGVRMTGIFAGGNPSRKRVTLETSTNDQIVNVTAADIEIDNIEFVVSADQTGAACVDFSADADGLYIHDCSFDFTAGTAATTILGIDAIGAANDVTIRDCTFLVDGAFGAGVDMTGVLDGFVSNCHFLQSAGTWAAAITAGAATDRVIIDNCHFTATNAAVMTTAVSGTGATIASGVRILPNCSYGDRVRGKANNFDAGESEGFSNIALGQTQYLRNAITMASGTTGSVATHETFTVTGAVRVRLMFECTTTLTGATATISYGEETAGTSIIAATTGTDIIAGELWYDTTPTTSADAFGTAVFDRVIVNGADLGYAVATAALSGGVMVFHCWWEPLSPDGLVVTADGTGTL